MSNVTLRNVRKIYDKKVVIDNIDLEIKEDEEEPNMCKAIEDMMEKARRAGREEFPSPAFLFCKACKTCCSFFYCSIFAILRNE